ncbi:MAG: flagellar FliJ family protein [Thermacetogeniaceae bacterium]
MNRFRFRLQKYMNLKQQQEDLQRPAVASARVAYEEEKRKLEAVDQGIADLLKDNAALRQRGLDIELLLSAESYYAFLISVRQAQAAAVESAGVRLAEARDILLAFQRDRKLLQRLRAKRWLGYYQDFLATEQKNLDEIGTVRSGQQGRRLRRSI